MIDLDEDIIAEVPCGQEATVHFHHALNAECGLFSEYAGLRSSGRYRSILQHVLRSRSTPVFRRSAWRVTLPEPCAFAFEDECGEAIETAFEELSFLAIQKGSRMRRLKSSELTPGPIAVGMRRPLFRC